MTSRAATAAVAYAALRTAAHVADHWFQTGHQAMHKADPGVAGHRAMTGHIASYTGCQAVALMAVNRILDAGMTPRGIAAAVVFSATTHWFIDRRWPVRRLAEATNKSDFHALGGPLGGAYILDQSAHHLMEGVAAVLAGRK